jgi:hypothetical protein
MFARIISCHGNGAMTVWGSAGGKASAIIQRAGKEQRIKEYNSRPVHCLSCNIIEYNGDPITIMRKRKFCNLSCSSRYNKKGIPVKVIIKVHLGSYN